MSGAVEDFYGGMTLNHDDGEVYILHKSAPVYDLIKVNFADAGCVGTVTTLSGTMGTDFPQDMTYDTTTSKFLARDTYAPPQALFTFATDGVATNIGNSVNDMRGLAFAITPDTPLSTNELFTCDQAFLLGAGSINKIDSTTGAIISNNTMAYDGSLVMD